MRLLFVSLFLLILSYRDGGARLNIKVTVTLTPFTVTSIGKVVSWWLIVVDHTDKVSRDGGLLYTHKFRMSS